MENQIQQNLEIRCYSCSEVYVIKVGAEDLFDFRKGKFAQDAFPYLADDQRELLISRTCGPCFDRMFPDED